LILPRHRCRSSCNCARPLTSSWAPRTPPPAELPPPSGSGGVLSNLGSNASGGRSSKSGNNVDRRPMAVTGPRYPDTSAAWLTAILSSASRRSTGILASGVSVLSQVHTLLDPADKLEGLRSKGPAAAGAVSDGVAGE